MNEQIMGKEWKLEDHLNSFNQFIAVEGPDCAGKSSITDIIASKGIDGIPVEKISFPQYDIPSGKLIESYLNGDFGEYSRLLSPLPSDLTAVEWVNIAKGRHEKLVKEIALVMNIFALNRIEFFKTFTFDPNKIYIFDRFSLSNIIYHISALEEFFNSNVGQDFMEIIWKISNTRESLKMFKFNTKNFNIRDMIRKDLSYEWDNDVPISYNIILRVKEATIINRLTKRKKKIERDILEVPTVIHRTCEFMKDSTDILRKELGVAFIDIDEFDQDNEKIATQICEQYKIFIRTCLPKEMIFLWK